MSDPYVVVPPLGDLILEVPDKSIISRTIFEDEQQRVVLFGFAPGESLSEHTASHPAVLYIVSGSADLTLGRHEIEAGEGTWIHMSAGLAHSVIAKTELILLLTLQKASA